MKRILIVRMGSLGDIVHALPVAATLKHAFPDAEIDWLVEQQWTPLLARNPYLTNVQVVHTHAWRKRPAESATWRSLAALISALRRRHYDCALDFQGLIKSAALARLAGARRVIGWHRDELREPMSHFLHTSSAVSIEPGVLSGVRPPAMHIVDRNLALAAAAGAKQPVYDFSCEASAEDELKFSDWCRASGLQPRAEAAAGGAASAPAAERSPRYAVLSPGAGWEAKCWPEECFAELAERIARELRCRVVINCGPGEEALAGRVLRLAGSAEPLLVKPSVGELIALVRHAALLVAGDTGPLHLAAACGTPVVGIFGATDPARNGPFGSACRVARVPDARTHYGRNVGREAISAVTVDTVFEAAKELLEAGR